MEPVSTSGFTALLKLYGIAIMVTLAVALVAAVVLMTRMPRSPQEWAVGLICTVVSSLAGGSFIIVKWGLHE
ncbi:putative membrane protein, partial [Acinetobacter baumannii 724909]